MVSKWKRSPSMWRIQHLEVTTLVQFEERPLCQSDCSGQLVGQIIGSVVDGGCRDAGFVEISW